MPLYLLLFLHPPCTPHANYFPLHGTFGGCTVTPTYASMRVLEGSPTVTIVKAKMYRTARIAEPIFSYKVGDYVAIQFLGRGSFGLNFRISFPGKPTIVVADTYLTDFVL